MKQKNKLKTCYIALKQLIYGKPVPVYKQELLLRKALLEHHINPDKLKIKSNHINGTNCVNGIELNIKYPMSFFEKAKALIPEQKSVNFYFNGNMNDSGKREIMLKPFIKRQDAFIISSNEGRIQDKKDQFNKKYFSGLANAKFGLCPHQLDWPGDKKNLWTYRFIECCFTRTVPILFRKTPLGDEFIKNFSFYWDDIILSQKLDFIEKDLEQLTLHNQLLAQERFCLTKKEIIMIKKTLD